MFFRRLGERFFKGDIVFDVKNKDFYFCRLMIKAFKVCVYGICNALYLRLWLFCFHEQVCTERGTFVLLRVPGNILCKLADPVHFLLNRLLYYFLICKQLV